jgi:hypothetical protein
VVQGCGRRGSYLGNRIERRVVGRIERRTTNTLQTTDFTIRVLLLISMSMARRRLPGPAVTLADRLLDRPELVRVLTRSLADRAGRIAGCGLGRRERCRGRGGQLACIVKDTARDRVGAQRLKVVRVKARLEMRRHPFRVSGGEREANLGLTVRVDRLVKLMVRDLREMLMREHQPEPVPAGLRERGCHPLRQVTEAVALIDQAEERRPVGERERPETLRGLPRTMKEYGAD